MYGYFPLVFLKMEVEEEWQLKVNQWIFFLLYMSTHNKRHHWTKWKDAVSAWARSLNARSQSHTKDSITFMTIIICLISVWSLQSICYHLKSLLVSPKYTNKGNSTVWWWKTQVRNTFGHTVFLSLNQFKFGLKCNVNDKKICFLRTLKSQPACNILYSRWGILRGMRVSYLGTAGLKQLFIVENKNVCIFYKQ